MSNQADPAVAAPQFIAAKPWADMLAAVESNEFAARTAKHLSEDLVFWLTTVTPSGLPSPNPVWFLWDGASTIRTFAMADGARIRNDRHAGSCRRRLARVRQQVRRMVPTGQPDPGQLRRTVCDAGRHHTFPP